MALAVLVPPAALAGFAAQRRSGWAAPVHRAALVALMLPWVARHASLSRLARSDSLNRILREASALELFLADALGPALVVAAVTSCVVWARALRVAAVFLPLAAEIVIWWVSLPLYSRLTVQGWFFVTEGLGGSWAFAWQAAASAFLGGLVLPSAVGERGRDSPS